MEIARTSNCWGKITVLWGSVFYILTVELKHNY